MAAICLGPNVLTHCGLDKMDAALLTNISNKSSWIKDVAFWLKFAPGGLLGIKSSLV